MLRRRLLGYSSKQVHQLLLDRDGLLAVAEDRVRTLEREVVDLKGDLLPARAELVRKDVQIDSLRAELDEARHQVAELGEQLDQLRQEAERARQAQENDSAHQTLELVLSEVGPVLTAAQEAATRIIEDAQGTIQERLAQAEGARQMLTGQVQELGEWRDRIGPMIGGIQMHMQETRATVTEVPERIAEALSPLVDLLTSMSQQLSEFARVSVPPRFEDGRDAEQPSAPASENGPEGGVISVATRESDGIRVDANGHLQRVR